MLVDRVGCGKIPVNMTNTKYTQGQRIYFKLGDTKPEGWAVVEGHQGFVIIIKPDDKLPNYEFTHMYIVDSQVVEPPGAQSPDRLT